MSKKTLLSEMRRHVLAVSIVAAGAAVIGLLVLHHVAVQESYPEAATIGSGVATFQDLSDRFTALAKAKGGVYAFDVLKIAPLPPNTDTHLLGHAIGDILYKQQGISGIAYCTQDFRNACSHAIVIGVLNEFGPVDSTLKMIDDGCKKAPGGVGAYTMCYHGLGHGVFAYFGYDLDKTAAFCRRMGTAEYNNEQFTQCVGGAVMELLDGGGHDHDQWLQARAKYLSSAQPLAPCSNSVVPSEAKWFCYLYLTPHLFESAGADIGNPDPATFPKAFSYCDALPAGKDGLRDACFEGFGKEFVALAASRDIRSIDRMSDQAYSQAAAWCEDAGVADGKESCINQALGSVFWGGENDPSASFRFCADVPHDLTDACMKDLGTAIGRYMQGPQRTHWCANLPESDRQGCSG